MSVANNSTGGLTRRGFLKAAGAAAGALGLAGAGSMVSADGWLAPVQAEAQPEERVACTYHQNHCHGCCSLKCTVRDGRLCLIEPNDWKNDEYKSICLKGLSEIQHIYGAERIQTPLKRVGERGSGEFVSITWDEAMEDLKTNLEAVWDRYGKDSVLIPQALEPGNVFTAKLIGAQASGNIGLDLGWGNALANMIGSGALEVKGGFRDLLYSKTIINMGGNPLESRLVHGKHIFDAKERGAVLITVDPLFSTTASKSDQWIPINPGTDAALLLGMISVVLDNGWIDEAYVAANTGFAFLVNRDTGKLLDLPGSRSGGDGSDPNYAIWDEKTGSVKSFADEGVSPSLEGTCSYEGSDYVTVFQLLKESQVDYPVSWASEKTGIPEDVIVSLADRYANHGPSAMNLGFGGSDKYSNADIVGHAAGILAALTGNIGVHGGGVGNIYPGKEPYGISLGGWSLPSEFKAAAKCENVYDLPYDDTSNIHAAIFFSGVFILRHGDFNAAKKWINTLDYVVMTDIYHSPDTDYADLVLPACSKFECRENVGGIRSKGGRIMLQEKIVDPLFESKTDFEIELLIARAFGLEGYLPETAEEFVRAQLEGAKGVNDLTLEALLENGGIYEVIDEIPPIEYENQVYKTKSGKIEPYDETMLPYGQQLPRYEDPDEAFEGNPLREKYPLTFAQPRTKFHIHAQFCDAEWIRQFFEPTIDLNPIEMSSRQLETGDVVEVFNDRGSFKCKVRANEAVRPGTASMIEGIWEKYLVEGNIQNVTNGTVNPRGYDLPLGPVIPFNDTLIEVRKA